MESYQKFIKSLKNKFRKLTCWHQSLLFLAIFLFLVLLNKRMTPQKEGFIQHEKYVEKKGIKIFDEFYVTLYDSLYKSTAKDKYEIGVITENTNLGERSKLLDIGSGTGTIVGHLSSEGYDAEGIDVSSAMIEHSKEKYPDAKFSVKDALVSMSFPANNFTHITCLFFTIYYIENKLSFFTNCMNWLKPGGYLVLHLVDRENFDPIIPAADPLYMVSPQKYAEERITNSYVKFEDCEYKSNFTLKSDKDLGIFSEKIKSDANGHVRQNIHKLYMPTQKSILNQAKDVGFIMHSKHEMTKCLYENQFLYILTKPN